MRALRVLIVDDEPLARMRLAALVGECDDPRCQVAGEAGDPASALAWLAAHEADVVLLDVQMPGASGLQLARRLRDDPAFAGRCGAIVFVTAHAEHALQAFELEATDYLTKPVRRERLQQSLRRVAQRLPADGDDTGVVIVNDRGRVLRVPLAEVLYLKAELKYVTLRTAEHAHLLDESLTELEPRLAGRFIRVHRNALVARRAVRALERRANGDDEGGEGWAVRVAPVDEWLAVSRRQLPAVREALGADGL
ncbi:MAG: LytR/AlgR family response regulator transcription factor [Gammaproteobacteria bacterium]